MRITAWLVLLLLAASTAIAQDTIYRIEPRKVEDIPEGKAVMVDGKAGPNPHRFLLENLTILTPVVVTLRPVNEGDDIRLKITKFAWNQPERQGSTKEGQISFKFRTEGEFQISVDADRPETPYKLLVWVGDEVKDELPSVIVPKSEYKDDSAWNLFGGGMVTWVIAAALVGIFGLLAVLVFRKKRE